MDKPEEIEESEGIRTEEKPKKVLTEEQLQQKRNALKKAVARKKELGLIRKAEMETKKADENTKIEKAKQQIEELSLNKPKKVKKVIEKVIEESSSSEEEEIIERIIIKKKREKEVVLNDVRNFNNLATKTNKELLQTELETERRKRLMSNLFDY